MLYLPSAKRSLIRPTLSKRNGIAACPVGNVRSFPSHSSHDYGVLVARAWQFCRAIWQKLLKNS